MREMLLTQGRVALVDDADFEWLSQWKWHAFKMSRSHTFYAARMMRHAEARALGVPRRKVLMHMAITGFPETDHKDGNGLNNQRANLRAADRHQNTGNTRSRAGTSRYKGVSRPINNPNRWRATIMSAGRKKHLGYFSTEEDAARAYNEAAVIDFGEYAQLNIVED